MTASIVKQLAHWLDGQSKETVLSEDRSPKQPEEIDPVLDAVVCDLLAGAYRRA